MWYAAVCNIAHKPCSIPGCYTLQNPNAVKHPQTDGTQHLSDALQGHVQAEEEQDCIVQRSHALDVEGLPLAHEGLANWNQHYVCAHTEHILGMPE